MGQAQPPQGTYHSPISSTRRKFATDMSMTKPLNSGDHPVRSVAPFRIGHADPPEAPASDVQTSATDEGAQGGAGVVSLVSWQAEGSAEEEE